jgi:hypothetical protein
MNWVDTEIKYQGFSKESRAFLYTILFTIQTFKSEP